MWLRQVRDHWEEKWGGGKEVIVKVLDINIADDIRSLIALLTNAKLGLKL